MEDAILAGMNAPFVSPSKAVDNMCLTELQLSLLLR